ncbi:MAG: DUF3108 domain-containing protein [Verrucomicrobia bacterium]|nr:DUF3108 domain-containing protein [Verrucomicrobiota bacterium]
MRLLILFLVTTLGSFAAPLPLRVGETMTFRVGWGIFQNAGEIKVAAKADSSDGKPEVTITTLTTTRGLLGKLYKFEARADAVFDAATGRMKVHTEKSFSGRKSTSNAMQFDYAKGTADYIDLLNSDKNLTVALPAGDPPLDLITSLLQTRTWDLKPGETRDANVIFEEEIYQLTLHAIAYEKITTPLGTFDTIVYEPRMEKTPPRGMFKKGSTVRVWIAQDGTHLPVRFQVDFKFGAGVATLVAHDDAP